MKTETLKSLHKRAAFAASLLVAGLVAFILVYMTAVEKGALPSVTQSLVQKSPPTVASNQPSEKVETLAAPPPPAPATPATQSPAPAPGQVASSRASSKPAVVEVASVAPPTNALPRPPQIPAITNTAATIPTPTRPAPPNSSDITADDKRVARNWLENTNQRPAIRVQYYPADILRLATELNRGLLVAGNGSTNCRELFLQFASGKTSMFGPLTKAVAQRFADYSVALNPSPTFPTMALAAYFPDDDQRLTFVPDRPLAELIFAHVARASRTFQASQLHTNNLVFEGKLVLAASKPVFDIVAVRSGGQQLLLSADTSRIAVPPRTDATSTQENAP